MSPERIFSPEQTASVLNRRRFGVAVIGLLHTISELTREAEQHRQILAAIGDELAEISFEASPDAASWSPNDIA